MPKEIVEFENGVVGTISIGGVKTAELNFFEILVNGRRNKRGHDVNNLKAKTRPESDSNKICYHCTVKATKDEVRLFFEDKRERLKEMARILSRVYLRSVQNREKDKTNACQFLGKEPGSHNNPAVEQMNYV